MYHKYSTECIVLGSRERGESDRVFALYTQEFGLIWARASAVRTDRSRMRYALTHYSRARISLIRGKQGWRIAGAIAYANIQGPLISQQVFARAAALITRLVVGEERHEYLFQTLCEAHAELSLDREDVAVIELIIVARILHALGYLSAEALGTSLFTHTLLADHAIAEARGAHSELLSSINRALSETHL